MPDRPTELSPSLTKETYSYADRLSIENLEALAIFHLILFPQPVLVFSPHTGSDPRGLSEHSWASPLLHPWSSSSGPRLFPVRVSKATGLVPDLQGFYGPKALLGAVASLCAEGPSSLLGSTWSTNPRTYHHSGSSFRLHYHCIHLASQAAASDCFSAARCSPWQREHVC